MGRRSRHWLLVFAVTFALLGVILVAAVWLIFSGERGWSRADKLALAAVVATIGGGIGAQFGTPLFERWLDKRSGGGGSSDGGSSVAVSDGGAVAVGETATQSADGDFVGRDQFNVHVSIGSLEPQPAPAQAPGQVVVGELPGKPPAFVARDGETRLAEVFKDGGGVAAVSALTGQRGAGKTQVAAAYARQAVIDGVGLVAWISADDHGRLLTGLAEVARRLGVADPEGDPEISAERLRNELAARTAPAVLVLDNATDLQDVRRYLPSTGATRVIITSTDRAFAALGRDVPVDRFERAQSLAYLRERTALSDEPGADVVAKELEDLPLAIAQAASVIALQSLTYDVYLDRLRALPLEEMLPADRGGAYPHGVARAIMLSIDAIQSSDPTDMTKRVLAATALLASDGVSRQVLANVLDIDAARARQLDTAVARIVESSLAVWTTDRRGIVMHRLVARAIRDQLQTAAELNASISSTVRGLEKLLVEEDQAWEQRDASTEIVAHAIDLWENIARATTRDVQTQQGLEHYAYLAHWAVRHLRATADLSRAIDISISALATCERVLGPDHPDTLTFRNNLAITYESAGKLGQAIPLHQETVAARERVLGPNDPQTLTSRNNLAIAYESAGNLDQAIPLFEKTLAARERVLGPDHPQTLTSRKQPRWRLQVRPASWGRRSPCSNRRSPPASGCSAPTIPTP